MTPDVLLLSGSPRGKKSTSYSLLEYLRNQLRSKDTMSEIHLLHAVARDSSRLRELALGMDAASYVILAAPLYVDSFPGHVVDVFSKIVEIRESSEAQQSPRFTAIMNCGFPEAHQNNLALAICERFAFEAGLRWIGGLSYPGGPTIDGTPLAESGFRGRHVRPSIECLAELIVRGEESVDTCSERISKLVLPRKLYIMASQIRWKRLARNNRVGHLLDATPYASSESLD